MTKPNYLVSSLVLGDLAASNVTSGEGEAGGSQRSWGQEELGSQGSICLQCLKQCGDFWCDLSWSSKNKMDDKGREQRYKYINC